MGAEAGAEEHPGAARLGREAESSGEEEEGGEKDGEERGEERGEEGGEGGGEEGREGGGEEGGDGGGEAPNRPQHIGAGRKEASKGIKKKKPLRPERVKGHRFNPKWLDAHSWLRTEPDRTSAEWRALPKALRRRRSSSSARAASRLRRALGIKTCLSRR